LDVRITAGGTRQPAR